MLNKLISLGQPFLLDFKNTPEDGAIESKHPSAILVRNEAMNSSIRHSDS